MSKAKCGEGCGRPQGWSKWPSHLFAECRGSELRMELRAKPSKADFRELDAWGMAYLAYLAEKSPGLVKSITFSLPASASEDGPTIEALRRRLSFLAAVNPAYSFTVALHSESVPLYTLDELFNRKKSGEVVRKAFGKRGDKDKQDYLEKALQTFLYGRGMSGTDDPAVKRPNDRLAILGEDFYQVKGKSMGVIREFPTGAFLGEVKEAYRVMPTEYVDLVSADRSGRLAVIELKLDDPKLEVLSQLLDYALFFRCYRDDLKGILAEKLGKCPSMKPFTAYVVNNHYHPRFDEAAKLYKANEEDHGFTLVKLTLGYRESIGG